jgi:hypothetical protein
VLERAGVPAVSICTDAFAAPARAMAEMYGLPDFAPVMIPHPIASLTRAEIEANIREVIPDVIRILMGAS